MNKIKLRVKKLTPTAKLPTKAHASDMCYDLYSDGAFIVFPHSLTKISTGIACGFPEGYGALIHDRSGVATKKNLFKVAGVIDNEYIGEVLVALRNPTDSPINVESGEKIAQLQLVETIESEIEEVDELLSTNRNDKGFGSSGTGLE